MIGRHAALMMDGTLGVDARLTPHQLDAAETRFGARLAAVINAETAWAAATHTDPVGRQVR